MAVLACLAVPICAQGEPGPAPPRTVVRDEAAKQRLLGEHKFSLQWISWERFGRAEVTERDGTLFLRASQRQEGGGDFIELEGIILEVRSDAFIFQGKIVTQVSYIFGGQPCKREGAFTFRITGKRKYWRLKEMQSPCDDVVDYVDVYFR
jgi:hypothetical protein